jgi:hypothetical protein
MRRPISSALIGGISIAILMAIGLWPSIEKLIHRQSPHEKITAVLYSGNWSFGEYRECDSSNVKTQEEKPELDCVSSLLQFETDQLFKVSFSGDLTYDAEKPETEVHHWLCRRNNADPSFSCRAKDSNQSAQPANTESTNRELTDSEMETLRKRNECEQRFYDKKIYEVDGMSIGPACEENPDRLP